MFVRSCFRGSTGATSGAKLATSRTMTTTHSPATVVGLLRSRRRARRPPAGGAAGAAVSSSVREVTSVTLPQTDARVEDRVNEINREGDEYEQNRRDKDAALDHRKVAA
jgi:hypothetical protein